MFSRLLLLLGGLGVLAAAAIADVPEASPHTSITARIEHVSSRPSLRCFLLLANQPWAAMPATLPITANQREVGSGTDDRPPMLTVNWSAVDPEPQV